MRYCPEPQNNLCHYPHGICAYQQECEQSSERNFLPEPQSESYCYDTNTNYGWEGNSNAPYDIQQETSSLDYIFNKFMQDYPPIPQSDPHPDEFYNYSHCGWEDQNQKAIDSSYSIYQEPSLLEQTFNSFIKNCPPSPPNFSFENSSSLDSASTQCFFQDPYNSAHQPQNSFHNSQNSFYTPQHNFTTTHPCHQNYSQPSSLELAVEDYLQWSKESLESRCQVIERQGQLLEKHKQSWKEILFKKMDGHLEQRRRNLGVPSIEDKEQSVSEEVEEQDKESPSSIETENCIEEGLIEPPIQKAFDEDKAPTTTQPPCLDIQGVKATNKSTEKRIVTKIPVTTFKKRSTINNPTPDPASKLKQATNKRKLAEERPRQGTIAESSPP
ncbi:hypothetical protein AHAS_Ahas15G0226600 [Arachis hypogaea]